MTGELGRGDQIMMVEGKTFIDISRPIAEKFLQKCMDSPEVNINLQSGSPITPPPSLSMVVAIVVPFTTVPFTAHTLNLKFLVIMMLAASNCYYQIILYSDIEKIQQN